MGMLSLLLWTPAIGSLLLIWIPGQNISQVRLVANLSTTATLLLSAWLLSQYAPHDPALQFTEFFAINPALGSAYSLGVDGLSMPLLMLCTLLSSAAMLASLNLGIHAKAFHLCLLVLEFGMLGVLLAQDWVLFYIFWEISLIPLFFLIGRWGGNRSHAASLNFVFYALVGSVSMLISLLALSQYHLEHSGSLMTSIQNSAKAMPVQQQVWVLLGFLLGFGIKLPIFPLHGWLPLAFVKAPVAVSLLLSGVLFKMAAYGLLRVLVILPDAAHILQPLLVLLALTGMLYGCLLAWRQSHLKAMIAYASISQMGVVLLGISNLNQAGIQSAVLQMTAHSLTAGALLLLTEQLYQRTHSRLVQDYGGLIPLMPRWSGLMIISLFAAMNLPGTIGFIAELQTLAAFYPQWGWLWVFIAFSLLITAAYLIRTLSLLFIGEIPPPRQALEDSRPLEALVAGIMVTAIVALGLLPESLLDLSASTISHLHHLLNPLAL
ncbi:MAG: NADH-quinone oxidoreductase subunit M [Methylovulum sp.]|uniref:complex I subunit 4 family protein n=1 Tax=Methylovulum sp. TaxID=1916980 RepID=UPI00261ACEA8|nr:NADH-quinone oxidoreductase subunit M [Methylovulum sp.]MDD2723189.1 NADH-quinone oxidoreductase subunit M [Methylovulum sp.]MDD5123130.1 NADH-quinone oxidoreductase subunit M [Methylovulum sp.]